MSFKQISINIDSKRAEILADLFMTLGAFSSSIEDQFEGTELEQAIFNEPGMDVARAWQNSTVMGLFDATTDIPNIVTQIKALSGFDFEFVVQDIDDQDWVTLTQNQFEPIAITSDFYIVPSWHQIPANAKTSIILDPGLAFGTGSHPTTNMCLKWIAKHVSSNTSCLDYGCGSGILAIACKKFASPQVVGVDIDPQAIEASNANAKNNQVEIDFVDSNLHINNSFDVVIANILSNPLRILAPILANFCKNKLILSGILDSQIDELRQIYQKFFAFVVVSDLQDGWVVLECTK